MTTEEVIRRFGVEYIGKFYSIYRGVVMDDVDPNNQGRLQIHLPSIHNGITVWANSRSFYGGPDFGFKYLTPKKGEIVFVEFESGDPLRAIWSYHPWAMLEIPEEFENEVIGVITPNGTKILLDDRNGSIKIETRGDVEVKTEGTVIQKGKEIHLQEGEVGIPQTTDLVKRLNDIEKKVNKYITAMKTSPPITSADQGKAFKSHMVLQVEDSLSLTKAQDIESKTIKQPR